MLASRTATGQIEPGGETRRERRDDRIAGAGDVEHLRRLGREMLRAVVVEQRHAVLGARDQHRAEAVPFPQQPSAAASIAASVSTGIPVASASSRRFGVMMSAPA